MGDEQRFKNKWAFLIGVSNYARVRPLKWAAKDAEDLRDALVAKLGFSEDNVILLSDNSPLKPELSEIYEQLGVLEDRKIQEDDLLVFHYSGHGVRNDQENQDLLLPNGATLRNLEATGIPVERIVQKLRKRCNNVVLFLDMCREETDNDGGKGLTKGLGAATEEWVKGREGIATFFSCDPREFSYEIDSLAHGCFTHCLLQAIEDPQINTIGELDDYLRKHVPRINDQHKKKPQYPRLISNPREITELRLIQRAGVSGGRRGGGLDSDLVIERFNRGDLSAPLFALALQLVDPDGGPMTPYEQAMLRLLEEYCTDRLPKEELERMFRTLQKQALGKPLPSGPQSLR